MIGAVNTARKDCLTRGGRFVKNQCYMPEVDTGSVIPGEVIETPASETIQAQSGGAVSQPLGFNPSPWYMNKWLWAGVIIVGGIAVFASRKKGGSNV